MTRTPDAMTPRERERFHRLLLMAKESPYAGERRNALAAATRIADRVGLTLEEAARSGGERYQNPFAAGRPTGRPPGAPGAPGAPGGFRADVFRARAVRAFVDAEARQREEKRRHEEALAKARARGLDRDEARPAGGQAAASWRPRSTKRRSPVSHAKVLLAETRLSFSEIASISGLDLWSVVGLKLRMRDPSADPSLERRHA